MRKFPTTPAIVVLTVIALILGWRIFAADQASRYSAVHAVRQSKSEFRIDYTVDRAVGRIAREEWRLENIDGRSTAFYTVTDRRGSIARFSENVVGYDVTFEFERLVQDGIWELQSRPYRGKNEDVHSVRIAQVADTKSGSHRFAFTDPHYLATSAGREYHIHLDRNKPVPDLVHLDSISTADPRYQKIVDDFERFGTPSFKKTVANAREKLLKS